MQFKNTILVLSAILGVSVLGGSATQAKQLETDQKAPKDDVKIVTAKPGDTLNTIAKRYHITYAKLSNANKSIPNPNMIKVGDKIRIPKKHDKLPNKFSKLMQAFMYSTYIVDYQHQMPSQQQKPRQPKAAAQRVVKSKSTRRTVKLGSSRSNTYYRGFCTWYAKNRRPDLPNQLGNGGSWVRNARALGFSTGHTPRKGAIAEIPGHVMYVESVNKNGTINVSDMNYNGVGRISHRTIRASSVSGYIY